MKNQLLFILIGLLLITPVIAQQSQKTNRIFLDPFYRVEMIDGTPYTYNLEIDPPEGATFVKSAIITLQIWHNPTITYTITANGIACNTNAFTVSTTYANAGEGTILFDCSNVITKAGTYTIVITTDDDTGASTAWSDITYTSKPISSIDVHGTEYQVGDSTTIFIQLLENSQTPINNATCFTTIWYPDKSVFLSDVLMTYQTGSNGLYYYDNIAQSQIGVYMVDVSCEYETEQYFTNATSVELINGTYVSGDNSSVQESDDNRYVLTETGTAGGGGGGVPIPMLHFSFDETSGNQTLEEVSSSYEDVFGNPNLTVAGTSNTGVAFDGVDDHIDIFNTGLFNFNATEDIVVCFSINTQGNIPNNDYVIDMKDGGLEGWEIRGADDQIRFSTDRDDSGNKNHETVFEFNDNNWHTYCGLSSFEEMVSYVDGVYDDTTFATQIGSMTTTEGYNIGSNSDVDQFSEEWLDELCVWRGVDLNITTIAEGYNSTFSCEGGTSGGEQNRTLELEITIEDVVLENGTFDSFSILTEYQWDDTNGTNNIEVYVWNVTGSSWVQIANDLTYAPSDSVISSTLHSNISDFLDGGNDMLIRYLDPLSLETAIHTFKVDQVQLIQNIFVSYPITQIRGGGELHVTNYNFSKLNTIGEDVWTYSDRQLTEFNFDVVNETLIAETVWNFDGNILSGIISQFAEVVWNYTDRNLTFYPDTEITVNITNNVTVNINVSEVNISNIGDIWNYPDRNLTYYEDTTNYTLIEDLIVGSINITDLTNYTLIYELIENRTVNDLTNYTLINELINNRTDIINYTLIQELIENRTITDLTNYTFISELIENRNVSDLTNYTLIYEIVENRTVNDLTNYTLISELVNNRTDIVNYTLIYELIENRTVNDLTNYTLVQELINNRTGIINYTLINDLIGNRTDLTNYTLIYELIENRTITDLTNYTLVQELITNRNDITDYDKIQDMLWNATVRTLTEFNFTVDVNLTEISNAVWTSVNRTLTDFNFTVIAEVDLDAIAETVWNATNRSLTTFDFDIVNYTLINDLINNRTDIVNYTLLYELIENRTDIVNYTLIEDLVGEINVTDLTNYTLINDLINNRSGVINYTLIIELINNRTDIVNYSLINQIVENRNVTDLTNYTLVFELINNRTDIIDYDKIQDMVWNNTVRDLTFYEVANVTNLTVTVDADAIADAVWQYNNVINDSILTQFGDKFECIFENIFNREEGGWGISFRTC